MKPLDQYFAARHAASQPNLGDRSLKIGSSEIGRCARHTVWAKLNPNSVVHEAKALGLFLRGRVLENEVIQLLRLQAKDSGKDIRFTGRSQMELSTAFQLGHPDGLEGDDTLLEVKTANTHVFRAYTKDGFNPPDVYLDQIQQNMGMARMSGYPVEYSRLVMANADDLATVEKTYAFDPEAWERLSIRAQGMVVAIKSETLPDGEPLRGGSFCTRCPIRSSCDALKKKAPAAGSTISFESQIALDEYLEALTLLAPQIEEAEGILAEEKRIKEEIKSLVPIGSGYTAPSGAVASVSGSTRSSFDSKALKSELPDVFARFATSTPVATLRVTVPKA